MATFECLRRKGPASEFCSAKDRFIKWEIRRVRQPPMRKVLLHKLV